MNSAHTSIKVYRELYSHVNSARRVAVIGNSTTLFSKQRDFTQYDLVVRMNKGISLTEDQKIMVGVRCDVYCASGVGYEKNDISDGAKYRVSMSPIANAIDYINSLGVEYIQYPQEHRDNLIESCGSDRPTTGLMVIDMITSMLGENASLDIYGFDFFKTPNFFSGNGCANVHNMDNEESYVNTLVQENMNMRIIK